MHTMRLTLVLLSLGAWAPPGLEGQEAGNADARVKALIEKVTSPKIDTRYEARSKPPKVGWQAVAPLVKLIDGKTQPSAAGDEAQKLQREIAITARAVLENIVHEAARQDAPEGERAAVARELAKALGPEATVKVKREVLHVLAFIAADAQVPAVAGLVNDKDPNIAEAARLSLERIPGKAAVDALLAAARTSPEARKGDFLFSVGKKGDRGAVPALLDFAAKSGGKVRLSALQALAHLGAVEAVPAFAAALKDTSVPERPQIFGEYLRLADNLRKGGSEAEAAKIFLQAISEAPLDHQRERALFQATAAGAGALDALLAGLSDTSDRVRKLAGGRLSAMKGPEVLGALRKAYERSKPEVKAVLLRVLVEKDRSAAEPLVAEASRSSQVELKLTALDLEGKLDNPELESTYLKAAKEGAAAIRPVAAKGLLLLASKKLAGGDKAGSLSLFSTVLEVSTADDQRRAALAGVLQVGDPKSIEAVGRLLKDPALAAQASKGFVLLAAKLGAAEQKDEAEKYLSQVVTGEFPRDVRNQAVEELRKLGRDPQDGVRRQGFVVQWWLLTPIQDPDGKGMDTEYFPEKTIDLENEQRIGPRRFRWQKLSEISLDGRIDLLTSFRRSEKVLTYAYTEVESPGETDVLFKMGSDDGIACWLNGSQIHKNNASRSLAVDEDLVKAHLKAGKNAILLKITNGGGDWGFAFRITDPSDKPLSLKTVR